MLCSFKCLLTLNHQLLLHLVYLHHYIPRHINHSNIHLCYNSLVQLVLHFKCLHHYIRPRVNQHPSLQHLSLVHPHRSNALPRPAINEIKTKYYYSKLLTTLSRSPSSASNILIPISVYNPRYSMSAISMSLW